MGEGIFHVEHSSMERTLPIRKTLPDSAISAGIQSFHVEHHEARVVGQYSDKQAPRMRVPCSTWNIMRRKNCQCRQFDELAISN
jgi:hypothetical protein